MLALSPIGPSEGAARADIRGPRISVGLRYSGADRGVMRPWGRGGGRPLMTG